MQMRAANKQESLRSESEVKLEACCQLRERRQMRMAVVLAHVISFD